MSELLRLSRQEILQEFPYLEEWFENHDRADIDLTQGKRLMSPEERVERAGGMDLVRSNVEIAKKSRQDFEYLVLTSCNFEPISVTQVIFFTCLFRDMPFSVPKVHFGIQELEEQGFLSHRRVTFISLYRGNQMGEVHFNWHGDITTEEGLRRRVGTVERKPAEGFVGKLVPGLGAIR